MIGLALLQQCFEPLGLLVLQPEPGAADGAVRRAGAFLPPWCAALALPDAETVWDVLERFPFLAVFWPDAQQWWAQARSGLLRSGIWNESGEGLSLELEAGAIVVDGAPFLVVGPYYLELDALQGLLQRARQLHLDHEALAKAERALAASAENIRAILAAIPDRYVLFDGDGWVLGHNHPEWPTLDGSGARFALAAAVGETTAQRMRALAAGQSLGSGLLGFEFEREVGSCRRVFEARQLAMSEGGFLCVLRDVSEARELDRRKAEFLAMAGHELRTPLTAIKGALAMVGSGFAQLLPDPARQMLAIAARNAERLLTLVNDLLDVQRVELGARTLVRTEVSAAALVARVVEDNQPVATELGVSLVAEAGAALTVRVDSSAMIQVLTNLVSNALKFSPQGGTVRVGWREAAQGVSFYVADQGPGIPEAYHDRVFEKFASIPKEKTPSIKGTGLGLSICKAIVEEHGGSIGFVSAPSGTTFQATLPV